MVESSPGAFRIPKPEDDDDEGDDDHELRGLLVDSPMGSPNASLVGVGVGVGYASLRSLMRLNRASSMSRASFAPIRELFLPKEDDEKPPLEDEEDDDEEPKEGQLKLKNLRPLELPLPGESGFWQ